MVEKLLTYGLLDGKLKHIDDVPNGQSCGCICPKCFQPLIAKNGLENLVAAHFAHKSTDYCAGAYESAIHLLAKEVFAETKTIRIPAFHFDYNKNNPDSLFAFDREIVFDEVKTEEWVIEKGVKIKADAIGLSSGKKLIIEFAKTHFVDFEKKNKIRTIGLPCIEFDLSNQILDKDQLKIFFRSNSKAIYWIENPRFAHNYEEFIRSVDSTDNLDSLLSGVGPVPRAKSLAVDIAKIKRDSKEKFFFKKYGTSIKVFEPNQKSGVVVNCPNIRNELALLKTTKYYTHEKLRYIIDGGYWNGIIYNNNKFGSYVYLEGKSVKIDVNNQIIDNHFEFGTSYYSSTFHDGLKILKKIFSENGVCEGCNNCIEFLYIEGQMKSVCGYYKK